MKLKKEIDTLSKIEKALDEVLDETNWLEYYSMNAYALRYIEKEIENIQSALITLKSMLDDKENLLLEEDEE